MHLSSKKGICQNQQFPSRRSLWKRRLLYLLFDPNFRKKNKMSSKHSAEETINCLFDLHLAQFKANYFHNLIYYSSLAILAANFVAQFNVNSIKFSS